VSIVTRGCGEATILVQTREDKFEELSARESFRMAQQVQRSQSPIEAVQTQMFSEPVLQLVFALERVSAESCWWVPARLQSTHSVEALNVADVLLHEELHLAGHVGYAATARSSDQRHVTISGLVVERPSGSARLRREHLA
jgi:hypothetical protein